MNTVLKVGLFGAAAYLLYEHFYGGQAATPATAPAIPAPTSAAATQTQSLMLAAASKDPAYVSNGGRMSLYQWGFYYSYVRGIQAPAAADLGYADGSTLISLDEYMAALTARGLSGIRGRRWTR